MRYLQLLLLTLLAHTAMYAAGFSVDKEWYVAGEQIDVEIDLSDKLSRVAYVELSDAAGVQTGTLAEIRKGRGRVALILPRSLHSGYYRLAVYTRVTAPLCMDVAVVNTLRSTADDKIVWQETEGKTQAFGAQNKGIYTLESNEMADYLGLETSGHTIVARLKEPHAEVTSVLSIVGKQVHVFGGKQVGDSILLFHTYGLEGKHQVVASAYTVDGKSLPLEIVSPYAAYLPDSLPVLHLNYSRKEVESRSIDMQKMALERTDTVTPLPYDEAIFSVQPVLHYDLDEYRQFATIGDTFVEYVNLVHHSERNGFHELFVYNNAEGYSNWPAMVLIDGMPTNDIKRLLKYDARRVHFINLYNDWFTLGTNSIHKGIVSFVTRGGNITNFPPDKGSAYIVYDFPKQNRY